MEFLALAPDIGPTSSGALAINRRVAPRDVLAQAKQLDEGKKTRGALRLLLHHRGELARVPPEYDAAIGRLSARSGDTASAVDFLARACNQLAEAAPTTLRRDLAMALLLDGQIPRAGSILTALLEEAENAGDKLPVWASNRSVCRAIELHRAGASNDEAAAGIDGSSDAVNHPFVWAPVAQSLQRRSHRTQMSDTKIERLAKSRRRDGETIPAIRRVRLGSALHDAGRNIEAGREFDLALSTGAQIDRLDFLLDIDGYRRDSGDGNGFQTSLGPSFTLVNPEKRLAYVSIKKNACTFLKSHFILNSSHREDFLRGGAAIHAFCETLTMPVSRETLLGPDYFRFVVLRDPFRRLVSVYLNKLVRNRRNRGGRLILERYLATPQLLHTIRGAQQLAGLEFDPARSISFAEFIRFLAQAQDYECNDHWLPQVRFVGNDIGIYQHVGKLERLDETLSMLRDRFGFVTKAAPDAKITGGARHAANHTHEATLAEPYAALPRELDAYENEMPPPDRFYTPELRELVERRFVDDFTLYRSAGG